MTMLLLLLWGQAVAGQAVPARLEPVARIGCVECAGAELFAGIQALTVGGGRIWVLDRSAPYVRVFDQRGRLVRSFGREGSGPGELRLPIHAGVRRGGVEIYDMTLRRLTRYDTAGAVAGTRTVPGFAALAVSLPLGAETYLLTTDFRTTDQPLLRLPDGAAAPTLLTTLRADFPRLAPGEHARTHALAARPGGGVAVGDGIAEYRIRRFDAAGAALPDIVRDVPKQRKTAAELEEERARMQRRAGRMQQMLRAENPRAGSPTFTPREERNHFNIDGFAYDEAGRLWVRTERGGLSATIFDVFTPQGAYAGEVRVAERLGSFALGGGLLAAVVRDADEVEFVGVWRVR